MAQNRLDYKSSLPARCGISPNRHGTPGWQGTGMPHTLPHRKSLRSFRSGSPSGVMKLCAQGLTGRNFVFNSEFDLLEADFLKLFVF